MKKLFIITFALLPFPAFAASIYYTYGNAPMIHGAFNAIAMMFNSSSFASAVEAIFVMSFAASVYMSVFSRRFEFIKYLFLSLFILSFFFWDKTKLVIQDVTLDETYVVDDVPYGYAFVGELISSFGHFVTDFTDTAFSVPTTTILFGKKNDLPSELGYSKIGFAGPFKAIKDLNSFELKDAQLKSDLNEYASKCLLWDALGLNSAEQKLFLNNGFLVNTSVFPNGLTSRYNIPVDINGYGTTCSTYFPVVLYSRIQNHVHNIVSKLNTEVKLLPYTSSIAESLAYFTNTSYTTYDAMVQSAVSKVVIKGIANGAYANDRDAYNQFITEMGIEEYQQKGNILARFGSQVMPIFKNVMEVLMIGVLPVILLFFILPNGWKLVSNYFQSLIWLQLWNPILSVINYVLIMAGLWQAQIAGEVAELSGHGLTIGNMGYLTDFAENYMAVAGYLMLSMPALATVVLMGGRWATGALANGIAMSAYGAAAQGASPQGMEHIQRQGVMSAEMVKWNESGIDTIGMQMNRQRGYAQSYMQQSTDAAATQQLMNKLGYAGSDMEDFFARRSTINAAKQGMQMLQTERTLQQMGGGDVYDGIFPSSQAKSMLDVSKMTAELESPQNTLDAMYGARSTFLKYQEAAANMGNTMLANKYGRMIEVLDSQISRYDANGDRQIDPDKIQEMKNDIAKFNQTRRNVEAKGFEMGSEEFDTPNSQALAMAALHSSGALRQAVENSARLSSLNFWEMIGSGSMDAAQKRANFNAAMEQWGDLNTYQKALLSAAMLQEAANAGKIEAWDRNGDGVVDSSEAREGMQRFVAMSTYMNRSEAQAFWETFQNDPNKAMEALEMKYGKQYEKDKAFAEYLKQNNYDPERIGKTMAMKEFYDATVAEGQMSVLWGKGYEIGAVNAAETAGKIDAMMDKWGDINNIQQARYSAQIIAESMLGGKISGWDTNGNNKIDTPEEMEKIQKYAAMTTYMNQSEAQEFWKTFQDDPNKALETLEYKYGAKFKQDKAFVEYAKENNYDPARIGDIMAREEFFKTTYNEGKNLVIGSMGYTLGLSEAVIRGADPKLVTTMAYANRLANKIKSGEMTQEEAVQDLMNTGLARGVAKGFLGKFLGGDTADNIYMWLRSQQAKVANVVDSVNSSPAPDPNHNIVNDKSTATTTPNPNNVNTANVNQPNENQQVNNNGNSTPTNTTNPTNVDTANVRQPNENLEVNNVGQTNRVNQTNENPQVNNNVGTANVNQPDEVNNNVNTATNEGLKRDFVPFWFMKAFGDSGQPNTNNVGTANVRQPNENIEMNNNRQPNNNLEVNNVGQTNENLQVNNTGNSTPTNTTNPTNVDTANVNQPDEVRQTNRVNQPDENQQVNNNRQPNNNLEVNNRDIKNKEIEDAKKSVD